MISVSVLEWLDQQLQARRFYLVPLFIVFVGLVYALVYMTGGIKYVYSHSMYVPILFSGILFGIRGGLFIGILGGIALGPFMPIDVVTGEMQNTANWLYRTIFFVLIGVLSGAASDGARLYIAHLKWAARHDPSTRLPNRVGLLEHISTLGEDKQFRGTRVLVAVALDNVVELKSAFGFIVVEKAVEQLARRFGENHTDRFVSRTETAQIGVLAHDGDQKIESLIDEFLAIAREPIVYNGIPIHIDTRMGIVTFDAVVDPPQSYLQKAEAALAMASEKAQDTLLYSPEILSVTEDNLTLLGSLKDAIADGQLSLHYQPKIVISTGQVHGVEALMRWQHPERGNIPPGAFIPRAEQSTLIQIISEFALEQAIRQIVEWQQQGIYIPVAVNISTRNLLQPGFADLVARLLDQYQVSGEFLELEATEGALVVDMERTLAELTRIQELKIIISIDDFGTGYSSLQYLHLLPISLIKVDQSFVRRLPDDEGAVSILEAAVMLAHKMGIKAIAEGVEDVEVYSYLGQLGCDMVQGYYVSRPLPAADFTRWYTACGGRFSL